MVKRSEQLAALEKIARMKAERELKKFAAFSSHMLSAQHRSSALRAALEQSYHSAAPLSVSEARMANAQAGRAARDLRRSEHEIQRLMPKFEAARRDAAREFGRAEVLLSLTEKSKAPRASETF